MENNIIDDHTSQLLLQLQKENESRVETLKDAIAEGVRSGLEGDFDPERHLQTLKMTRIGE